MVAQYGLQEKDVISCPVNDLLYEPSPRPLGTPLPSMGEGTGVRAGYRNCLYGHDMIALMRRHMKPSSFRMWRERVSGRKTKHIQKRGLVLSRFKSDNQKT